MPPSLSPYLKAFSYPAFIFPLGNLFLALDKAEIVGISIMTAMTFYGFSTKLRDEFKQKSQPQDKTHKISSIRSALPYVAIGTLNFGTAASVVAKSTNYYNPDRLLEFLLLNDTPAFLATGALIGWGFAHFMNAYNEYTRRKITSPLQTAAPFSAFSNILITGLQSIPAALSVISFGKSFLKQQEPPKICFTFNDLQKKHATPFRILVGAYFSSMALNIKEVIEHPFVAMAKVFWSAGYLFLDKPEDNKAFIKDFLKDTRSVLSFKFNNPFSTAGFEKLSRPYVPMTDQKNILQIRS